jgi:hypothetical protein
MKSTKGKHNYNLEIIGAFLALCGGLLGVGADRLGIPSQVYLPVIIGFLITATASLLKAELLERIDSGSRIQNLLNQIEREDLHKKGVEAVQECENVLEDLSRGIITPRSAELFKILVERASRTQHSIRATHLAQDISFLHNWEESQGHKNYYQANLSALKRGVKIERLFLLRRGDIINETTGPRALKIMEDQRNAGIEVFVTWLESIDPETAEDFIVFDNEEIVISYPLAEGKYYRLLTLHGSVSVRTYNKRFAELKASGQSLSELLDLMRHSKSNESPGV